MKRTTLTRRAALGSIAGAATLRALPAGAQGAGGLPETVAWTAYDVGSGSYNQGVAIGNALKAKRGVNLRLLPGANDVARLVPLRQGVAMFSANGVAGAYFAQEGVFDFAARDWGPQPVRAVMFNHSDQLLTIATARDANIRTLADLRGKRVAWVVAADALNVNVTAMMAFANLTWADVQKVEFPGFGAAMQGLIAGRVDAAFASTISGPLYQLESSARGLFYPPMPHADAAGWARLHRLAPYFVPTMGKEGAGITPDKPVEAGAYPFPILMTLGGVSDAHAQAMARAMVELFPEYKDAAPGNAGWDLGRQVFSWVVPFHAGAVAFYKSIGVWKEADEANNARVLRRQAVLAEAWRGFLPQAPAEAQFREAWMRARGAALAAAGMEPVFG
jgi:TRAP transporter TAXI family solute receptor